MPASSFSGLAQSRFVCPYGEQSIAITRSVCIDPNGAVTAENVATFGSSTPPGPVGSRLVGDCPDTNRDHVALTMECS